MVLFWTHWLLHSTNHGYANVTVSRPSPRPPRSCLSTKTLIQPHYYYCSNELKPGQNELIQWHRASVSRRYYNMHGLLGSFLPLPLDDPLTAHSSAAYIASRSGLLWHGGSSHCWYIYIDSGKCGTVEQHGKNARISSPRKRRIVIATDCSAFESKLFHVSDDVHQSLHAITTALTYKSPRW